MSELIIFGYDDHAMAERAYERVLELQADYVVSLSGLATVRIDEDGKKHIDTLSAQLILQMYLDQQENRRN